MPLTLSEARLQVAAMIENNEVPMELPHGVSLEELIQTVTAITEAEMKERLQPLDTMSPDQAEQFIQNTIEQVAMRMALITLFVSSDTETIELGISPDTVTQALSALLRGNGVSINIAVTGDD